jgi:hypothetical protein
MNDAIRDELRDPRQSDEGYFHLTPDGWVRIDRKPYPANRVETWKYQMEKPALDAKARVRLSRLWVLPAANEASRDALRVRFGDAVMPNPDRNVELDCRV